MKGVCVCVCVCVFVCVCVSPLALLRLVKKGFSCAHDLYVLFAAIHTLVRGRKSRRKRKNKGKVEQK